MTTMTYKLYYQVQLISWGLPVTITPLAFIVVCVILAPNKVEEKKKQTHPSFLFIYNDPILSWAILSKLYFSNEHVKLVELRTFSSMDRSLSNGV